MIVGTLLAGCKENRAAKKEIINHLAVPLLDTRWRYLHLPLAIRRMSRSLS